MSILVGSKTRLIVQGITGKKDNFMPLNVEVWYEFGGGVTPGKGGQTT